MSETALRGIAVVTGGVNRIGAACCRELARRGATVAVLDLDGAAAAAVACECAGRAWAADVTDETGIAACAAAIEAELGAVEILVNAGHTHGGLRQTRG
jgi:NAD(P)-dependent dehydrogenase (short-subunit alcohol dehydrogenase family)